MNPVRKIVKEGRKRPSREELLSSLIKKLQERKPVFHAHRVEGEVRIDMNGTTVGYVRIEEASKNVGISFKVKKHYGSLAMPVVYAKDGQQFRKKASIICAFLMFLFDDRPSEERRKSRTSSLSDSKNWYDSFSDGFQGELSEYQDVYNRLTKECKYLIDVFALVGEALRSARREDVEESVKRVTAELPFLTKKLSMEEWSALYTTAVVDQVHSL